jgi:hypothetical protein
MAAQNAAMIPAKKRGGKRPGSGRKPTGPKTLTRSLSLPAQVWQALDAKRGTDPRGVYVARAMGLLK